MSVHFFVFRLCGRDRRRKPPFFLSALTRTIRRECLASERHMGTQITPAAKAMHTDWIIGFHRCCRHPSVSNFRSALFLANNPGPKWPWNRHLQELSLRHPAADGAGDRPGIQVKKP